MGVTGFDKVLNALQCHTPAVCAFVLVTFSLALPPPPLLRFPAFPPNPCNAMCLTWLSSSLQAADVCKAMGAGVVELDDNGSVVMGGEEQGPSPLQGSTGATSADLDSLHALRSISQVRLAAPCV